MISCTISFSNKRFLGRLEVSFTPGDAGPSDLRSEDPQLAPQACLVIWKRIASMTRSRISTTFSRVLGFSEVELDSSEQSKDVLTTYTQKIRL